MNYVKKNFLIVTIVPLLTILFLASFVRFVVLHDYLITFEGECDPDFESCFEECEDDECTETYYYSIIERHALETLELCGNNVLECDEAYECQESAEVCSITFCDPELDGEDTCTNFNLKS